MNIISSDPHLYFLVTCFLSGSSGLFVNSDATIDTIDRTTEQDYRNMLDQLRITALRPGPGGRAQPGEPNAANYDKSKTNPYPDLPELLMLENGGNVTSPSVWWAERRPEIFEDFDREIIGRVPERVPGVEWIVAERSVLGAVVGGASLYRRNFVEAVENLTASGEYHWMAGNFLKYGAAESVFGSMDAGDLPVDAHQLIAFCAPRPTFISYGIPEQGDALWLDQQGSYMATVAAGPGFRLLGEKDLGVTEDYRATRMPAVNDGVLDGVLAWRQHDGGHEDQSNMSHFIAWANPLIGHTPPK